ncbi:MAG: Ig-like domain-containing protein [bacterium]
MRWFFSVVMLLLLGSGCTYTGLENVECDRTADCPDQAVCRSGFCAFDSSTNTNNTNNLLTVTQVTVDPGVLSLVPTQTSQLTATALNSAGDPLSEVVVEWSTSNEAVATVVAGLVTAVDTGVADITATVDGVSASATVTVVNPVDRLEVTPTMAEVGLATRFQLSAKAFDARGNEITVPLTWSSDDAAIATVSGSGQVFGVAVGETSVSVAATNTLTGENVEASATISVVEYPIVSLVIGPRDARVRQGDSLLLTAVLTDDQGNEIIGKTVTWSYSPAFLGGFSSPDPDTALFVATTQTTGTATIRAVYEELMDETTVEVYRPVVQTVNVNPANSTAKVGALVSFTASAVDEDGMPVTGRAVTWSVDDTALATIDANGQLKTLAAGAVTVTATIDGVMGSTQLTIAGFELQQVSAGTGHACGITPAGFAFCWGDGANGRLGNNATSVSSLPVAVDTDLTFDEIHAGNRHTCARTGTDIYCWGDQSSGRVGNGQTGNSDILTPTKVNGTEMFKAFSLSNDHTCAIDDQDDLYCWGEGKRRTFGQQQHHMDLGTHQDYRTCSRRQRNVEGRGPLDFDHTRKTTAGVYRWGQHGR